MSTTVGKTKPYVTVSIFDKEGPGMPTFYSRTHFKEDIPFIRALIADLLYAINRLEDMEA